MEPVVLQLGRVFHRRVQADWKQTATGGRINIEHTIGQLPGRKLGAGSRRGRLDIFVDEVGDFVSVVEIKATNWDQVRPQNRRKVMGSHRRQVWRYIEKFVDADSISVCPGIIYPTAPLTPGLRSEIEKYLNHHGLQVVWYED
jgi:hypothetical protein